MTEPIFFVLLGEYHSGYSYEITLRTETGIDICVDRNVGAAALYNWLKLQGRNSDADRIERRETIILTRVGRSEFTEWFPIRGLQLS